MQGPQPLRLVEFSSFLCFSIFCGGEISLLASLRDCRVLQKVLLLSAMVESVAHSFPIY
jgi:hypothetical protein